MQSTAKLSAQRRNPTTPPGSTDAKKPRYASRRSERLLLNGSASRVYAETPARGRAHSTSNCREPRMFNLGTMNDESTNPNNAPSLAVLPSPTAVMSNDEKQTVSIDVEVPFQNEEMEVSLVNTTRVKRGDLSPCLEEDNAELKETLHAEEAKNLALKECLACNAGETPTATDVHSAQIVMLQAKVEEPKSNLEMEKSAAAEKEERYQGTVALLGKKLEDADLENAQLKERLRLLQDRLTDDVLVEEVRNQKANEANENDAVAQTESEEITPLRSNKSKNSNSCIRFRFVRGPGILSFFDGHVGGTITIGKDANPKIETTSTSTYFSAHFDLSISNVHLKLQIQAATQNTIAVCVTDLGSRNGTIVRGKKLEGGICVRCSIGETITLGNSTILIESL